MSATPEDATDITDEVRAFWDADAAGYDNSADHYPHRPQEQAAWAAALRRLLPPPPATVLDIGAGTGFLSLLLAAQGYQVTAADLSPGMLARLREKAEARQLDITCEQADALHPPAGPFDAVVERHLLWTLPDPAAALAAWHQSAPDGRLVVIEGSWFRTSPLSAEGLRAALRQAVRDLRGTDPGHHDHYSARVIDALPYGGGVTPAQATALIEESGWGQPRLERLRDVEWALIEGRSLLDELLGTHPRWAMVAGR
jgi:SAM-dependent methyltransferase